MSALKNHQRELIELAALFVAAGLTDLFTDVLGHRIEGPSILIALGVVVAAVTFARHRPMRGRGAVLARGTPTPVPGSIRLADRVDGMTGSGGRLWRVRTVVEDRPGRLAVLAGAFAAVGANILTLQVHLVADGAVDEFLVQAGADVSSRRLGDAVAAAGGGEVHVEAAEVTALADVPTRALALAHRLTGDPGELDRVLLELLGATDVMWRPAGDEAVMGSEAKGVSGEGIGVESIAIDVGGPRAGVLVISRAQVPFTAAEFARAQAMADLAGAVYALCPVDEPCGEPSRA